MNKPTVKQIADKLQALPRKRGQLPLPRFEAVSAAHNIVLTTQGADAAGVLEDHLTKPFGYWTLERCKEDALRFKTRSEWKHGSLGGYVAAHRGGWLDDCCGHMVEVRKSNGYWTLERCKEDALRFKTRTEWLSGSSGYQAARQNGWLEECCGHMVEVRKPPGYWTLERCKEDALRFKTRTEWTSGSLMGYMTANREGWLDDCCGHMVEVQKPNGYWTLERCKADALRFKTRTEWTSGSPGYSAARKKGWLDDCCGHMVEVRKPHGYWTLERCKEDALRFRTRVGWKNDPRSGHWTASQNGWLDDCCAHMVEVHKPKGYWTLERCKEDALRFKTRAEWTSGSPSGQAVASRNGWLPDCCAHMARKPHRPPRLNPRPTPSVLPGRRPIDRA